jgi:hypothetical protein
MNITLSPWVTGVVCVPLAFANDNRQIDEPHKSRGVELVSTIHDHPAGSNSRLASLSSCDVNAANDPATAQEIQTFVTKYASRPICVSRLHLALEAIFEEEPRAERWAEPLERIVADAAASKGVRVSGGCHSNLCRYDVELSSAMEFSELMDLDRRVIDAAEGTPFEVASVHDGSEYKYRTYFYTTVAPAAFIKPLRRKMQTDKPT